MHAIHHFVSCLLKELEVEEPNAYSLASREHLHYPHATYTQQLERGKLPRDWLHDFGFGVAWNVDRFQSHQSQLQRLSVEHDHRSSTQRSFIKLNVIHLSYILSYIVCERSCLPCRELPHNNDWVKSYSAQYSNIDLRYRIWHDNTFNHDYDKLEHMLIAIASCVIISILQLIAYLIFMLEG